MITEFISLIDRLIQLTEYRNRGYRLLFDDLIEPAFDELLLVHKDYIQMFEKTYRLLPSGHPSQMGATEFVSQLKIPAEYLQERRIEFEAVRVKLLVLGKSMRRDTLEPDVKNFLDALVSYFHQWLPSGGSAASGLLATIEESIKKGEISEMELENEWHYLESHIRSLIERQRTHWSLVCEAFAPLKVRAAKSI